MSRKAIVLVTTSFPSVGDGSEAAGSFVSDFAEELAKYVSVRVVAPGRMDTVESWAVGVEVFRYAAPARPLSTLKPWRVQDALAIARVLRTGQCATELAVAAEPVAHVFALWALPSGVWARRAARKHGIGYSVWILGSDVWSLGRIPLLRGLLARVLQQAKQAYADGYQLAMDAGQIAGREIEFLPSTRRIGSTQVAPPRSAPPYRLLFLGRWHPNKGIDLLLDALTRLPDADWEKIERVEIQGGGPLAALVQAQVAALQAAGRPVVLGGFLAKPDAEAAIDRADWVLIPSRIESIPVVFSDAMKLGRPVVAMPVGDLPALLQGAPCGVLAKAVDADAFCAAMQAVLGTSPVTFVEGVAAQAERFHLEQVVPAFLAKVQCDG